MIYTFINLLVWVIFIVGVIFLGRGSLSYTGRSLTVSDLVCRGAFVIAVVWFIMLGFVFSLQELLHAFSFIWSYFK